MQSSHADYIFRLLTSYLHAAERHKTITPRSSQIAAFKTLT